MTLNIYTAAKVFLHRFHNRVAKGIAMKKLWVMVFLLVGVIPPNMATLRL